MEITGNDYIFISNIGVDIVEKRFMDMINKMWKDPIVYRGHRMDKGIVDIYIMKDEEMDKFSDEHAYALDKNGEGPLMFGSRKFSFVQGEFKLVGWKEPEELRGIAVFDGMLNYAFSLTNATEYTLVLPGLIEDSPFCKHIYDRFLEILK